MMFAPVSCGDGCQSGEAPSCRHRGKLRVCTVGARYEVVQSIPAIFCGHCNALLAELVDFAPASVPLRCALGAFILHSSSRSEIMACKVSQELLTCFDDVFVGEWCQVLT